jgi:NADH-quinone oxidoreductase subunit M
MLQRVNMGVVPERWEDKQLLDVTRMEYVSWAPLLVGILLLGVYPRIILGVTNEAVTSLMSLFGG